MSSSTQVSSPSPSSPSSPSSPAAGPGPGAAGSGRARLVVAIDGPAGAGKSTTARLLAERLGYSLLDTGAIYRSVALMARQMGVAWDDEARLAPLVSHLEIGFHFEEGVNKVLVDGHDVTAAIRAPDISDGASRVSALPGVRAALLGLQRRLGEEGGVVVEGRDVGTVVFPRAGAKFFLTASPEERARRRTAELRASGRPADEQTVLAEILERDDRDTNRAVAPLRKAPDAVQIDSDRLTAAEVVERLASEVRARGG
ncbi:MAG TPA: (d)CMP kinase [Polyangia bacterium]